MNRKILIKSQDLDFYKTGVRNFGFTGRAEVLSCAVLLKSGSCFSYIKISTFFQDCEKTLANRFSTIFSNIAKVLKRLLRSSARLCY